MSTGNPVFTFRRVDGLGPGGIVTGIKGRRDVPIRESGEDFWYGEDGVQAELSRKEVV